MRFVAIVKRVSQYKIDVVSDASIIATAPGSGAVNVLLELGSINLPAAKRKPERNAGEFLRFNRRQGNISSKPIA